MTSAPTLSDSRLANIAARAIADAWVGFVDRFRIVTRRARLRFEARDWHGMAADHVERLDLYARAARDTAAAVSEILGSRLEDRMVWAAMKAVYSGLSQDRPDWELAETFFNSVTRRIFSTLGVDERMEFVDTDFDSPPNQPANPVYRTYQGPLDPGELIEAMLADCGIAGLESPSDDAALAGSRVEERLRKVGALRRIDRAEVIEAVFFRGKGAYVIGRIHSGSHVLPIVLALLHPETGPVLDAVLLTENAVSILFSFARAHFHVDVETPYPLVHFLSTLMPRKRRSELYISIGHHKHGKTELYRELRRHLAMSGDRFEVARGTPGLVMEVFTLPGFEVVFKVMRDTFGPPKRVTREHVRSRYRLVFRHDRAGRLVDAQEFEHLELPLRLFEGGLLEALAADCSRLVTVADDMVAIAHAYVERRVTPLDVYLEDVEPGAAEKTIVDYGQAIKDMAASDIFPGDMLLKNFGVTRHGRVVFYDYDELTTLRECRFRRIPPAASPEEELASEPWFSVGPDDVFPEEFEAFLGLTGSLREVFLARHSDLLDAAAWQAWQSRLESGEMIEIFPYDDSMRLRKVGE